MKKVYFVVGILQCTLLHAVADQLPTLEFKNDSSFSIWLSDGMRRVRQIKKGESVSLNGAQGVEIECCNEKQNLRFKVFYSREQLIAFSKNGDKIEVCDEKVYCPSSRILGGKSMVPIFVLAFKQKNAPLLATHCYEGGPKNHQLKIITPMKDIDSSEDNLVLLNWVTIEKRGYKELVEKHGRYAMCREAQQVKFDSPPSESKRFTLAWDSFTKLEKGKDVHSIRLVEWQQNYRDHTLKTD